MNFKRTLLSLCILSSAYISVGHAQSLQDAVQLTLNENPEIQEARSVRMAYEQEIAQASSKYLPRVDVSAGYGLEQANTPVTRARGDGTNQLGRTESKVQLRQMIFDGFETPHEVARFTAKTDAQAYAVFGQSEMIGLQATQTYINVLRRKALFDLAAANLNLHKGFHEQIKMRTERGIGRVSDLDQATGRLARAESNLQAEQGNLKDAQTSYLRVIGVLPDQLTDTPYPAKAIPASLEEATELAIANHPTLKSANADITESLAQHNTASAPFYPKLNFEVDYDNNDDINGIRGRTEDLTAMARVSYNLFNGGKDKARRNQTAYEMYQAKNIRDNTYRQVVESVRLAWVAYKTVGSQLEFFKAHRDASTKTLNAYKQQFNIGQRTLLDLLDSTNEMYLANLAYTDAKYTELTARYRILAGMGQLNQFLGTTLPKESAPLTPDNKHPEMTYTAATEPKIASDSDLDSYHNMDLSDLKQTDSAAIVNPQLGNPILKSAPPRAINLPTKPHFAMAPTNLSATDVVKQRLTDWAEAWSEGDVNTYLNYYAADFTPDATTNHETWKQNRISRINPAKKIQVQMRDINVSPGADGNTVTTTFKQNYRAKNYHDDSNKILVWEKIADTWLIKEEGSVE